MAITGRNKSRDDRIRRRQSENANRRDQAIAKGKKGYYDAQGRFHNLGLSTRQKLLQGSLRRGNLTASQAAAKGFSAGDIRAAQTGDTSLRARELADRRKTPRAQELIKSLNERQAQFEKEGSRFVRLPNGKTGTKVDRTDPLFALSEKFAEKASTSGVSVSKAPNSNIGGSIVTPGAELPPPPDSNLPPSPSPDSLNPANSTGLGVINDTTQNIENRGVPPEEQRGAVGQAVEQYFEFGNAVEAMFGGIERDENGNITKWDTNLFGVGAFTKMFAAMGISSALTKDAAPVISQAGVLKATEEYVSKPSAKSLTLFKNAVMSAVSKIKTKLTTANLLAIGGVMMGVIYFAEKVFDKTKGSQQFGQFLGEEGQGSLGMAAWVAIQADRPDLALEALDAQRQAIEAARQIQANPLAPSEGLKLYFDALEKANSVMTRVLEWQAENPEKSFIEQLAESEALKTQAAKERTDYYNEQRAIVFDREQAARLAASLESDARRKKNMMEEAAFWVEQKEIMFKLEAEERERQAEFWLDYKKAVLQLERQAREENGRSSLRFGLLR